MIKYTMLGTDAQTLETVSIHGGESLNSDFRMFNMLSQEWETGKWAKVSILKFKDGEPVQHIDFVDRGRIPE